MSDENEEPFLSYGENGVQASGSSERMERRCSRVREGLERTTGLRKGPCKGSTSTPEWFPHPSSGSRADTETNHVRTSWTCEEPGFLNKRMNDHVTICESVESVCANDESEYGSNDNFFEMSRIKESLGEEIQGKERSSSESRRMDTARSNKLTGKQANPNIIMIDYDEQAQADNTNSVKTPRVEEPGEDEHDGDEFNSWPATKSTGNDDNTSTKYFHKSIKTKVIGDRDESGGSTRPTCSVHAPEMGSIQTTHGQSRGNMWERGQTGDPSADRLGDRPCSKRGGAGARSGES